MKQEQKKQRRSYWKFAAVWFVLVAVISLGLNAFAATDLTQTVAVDGLTVSDNGETAWTASAAGATWSQTTTSQKDGCNTVYTAYKGSIVLTNNSGTDKVLTFTYAVTLNGGSAIIDGTSVTAGSTFKKALPNGQSITITTASSSSATNTTTVTLSNIQLVVPDVTMTFAPAASGGSYTVDGIAVTASVSYTNPATKAYALVATPAEHYVFAGWTLNGSLYYTAESLPAEKFTENGTITATFVEDPLYKMATATGSYTKDQLVEINSRYYHNPSNHLAIGQNTDPNYLSRYCYKSVAATTGVKDDWDQQHMPFLEWTTTTNGIAASASGTAQGEWCTTGTAGLIGANSWSYAGLVTNMIRVRAVNDCAVTFNYTGSVSPTNGSADDAGNRVDGTYLVIYQSTNGAESYENVRTYGTVYRDASKVIDLSMAKGTYLYIVTSGHALDKENKINSCGTMNYSYSATITGFNVSYNEVKYTQTSQFQDNTGKAIPGGSLLVGTTGYAAAADGSVSGLSFPAGQTMKLSVAAAPANYKFLGWSVNGTMHYTPTYEYTLNKDVAIHPIFVPNNLVWDAATGKYQYYDVNNTLQDLSGQYVARNGDATETAATFYTSVEAAMAAESKVTLLGSITVNGDYTIPSGKTLIVSRDMVGCPAWDSTNSYYICGENGVGGGVYTALTVNNTLTVNGSLIVDGAQNGSNGGLTGAYGLMTVNGTVNVENGGALYAFGVVNGNGNIYAKSGAKVHETMEINDMRHPIVMKGLVDKASEYGVFLFNSIYPYSIEAKVHYSAGASMDAHYYSSMTGHGAFRYIGGENDKAIFQIHSGSMTKSFTSEYRILFRINEGAVVSTGALQQKMSASMWGQSQDFNLDSSQYLVALTSAYHIEVAGNFTFEHSYRFLPGAKLDVTPNGILTIASGADVVFYRLNDYDYRWNAADSKEQIGFSAPGYPIQYYRYNVFNLDTIGSAVLNVDGTLIANGGLYVTEQPIADRTEEDTTKAYLNYVQRANGWNVLTGTGSIQMNFSASRTTINENLNYNDTDPHITTVAVVPMKGLNADATADEAAQYTSLTGTKYGITNANGLNVWIDDPCANGHNMQLTEAEVAAKCGVAGKTAVYTCANGCGTTEGGEEIAALEHDMQLTSAEVAPQCGVAGKTAVYTCSRNCGHVTGGEEITALEHDMQLTSAEVAPQCGVAGKTAVYTCSRNCGHVTGGEEIGALVHSWDAEKYEYIYSVDEEGFPVTYTATRKCQREGCSYEETTSETTNIDIKNDTATCQATGTGTYEVTFAGDWAGTATFDNVATPKNKEHVGSADYEEVAPTCEKVGYTGGTYCTGCFATITARTEIPAGHTLQTGAAQEKTCTQDGWAEYEYCTACDYTTKEVIPAGHSLQTGAAQEKTCTQDGWAEYQYCTACDYTTKEVIPAGHELEEVEAKAPTCTEIGWDAYETCSRCNYTTYAEKAALDHDFTVEVENTRVEATCTTTGTVTMKCYRCEETEVKTLEKNPDAHKFAIIPAVPATCVSTGLTEGLKCSLCNKVLVPQENIEMTPHGKEVTYAGGKIFVKNENIAALKASSFVQNMSIEQTLGRLNYCVNEAAKNSLLGTFANFYGSEEFRNFVQETVGKDANELNNTQKSNATVLYVAQKLSKATAEGLRAFLATNTKYDTISRNEDMGEKIAQAALTYGMYCAYESCGMEWVTVNLDEIANCIQDSDNEGFLRYLEIQGERDLAGFLAAMETIHDAVEANGLHAMKSDAEKYMDTLLGNDSENKAVETLLEKGFNDPELVNLVQNEIIDYSHTCSCGTVVTKCEDYLIHRMGKVPTCTETGLEEASECMLCGATTGGQEIPKAEHKLKPVEEIPADCETEGTAAHWKCETCEGLFADENGTQPVNADELKIPAAHVPVAHEAKDATCSKDGNIAYWTCETCGKFFSNEECTTEIDPATVTIKATNAHIWGEPIIDKAPTCTEPGQKTSKCTNGECTATQTESVPATGEHKYVDGKCETCGIEEVQKPELQTLISSASVDLGNSLTLKFIVDPDLNDDGVYELVGIDNYAVVSKLFNGEWTIVATIPQSEWGTYSKNRLAVEYADIAAKQMADQLKVVIYNNAGDPVTTEYQDSVRDYAMRGIESLSKNPTKNALQLTMFVDFLNYGTAAQVNFKYNTSDLANSKLTEAQKAYATASASAENKREGDGGTNVNVESRIELGFTFDKSLVTTEMYAVVTYTNHNGKTYQETLTGADFEDYSKGTKWRIPVYELATADGNQMITCTIYDAEGNQVAQAKDSVNSYMARVLAASSASSNLKALAQAALKLAASSYAYFHK